MKAEDAKAKSDAAIPLVIEAEFNAIIQAIEAETAKGSHRLSIPALAEENREKLKELGYRARTLPSQKGFEISWADGGTGYQPKGIPKSL